MLMTPLKNLIGILIAYIKDFEAFGLYNKNS
jgi:hypothetical protein